MNQKINEIVDELLISDSSLKKDEEKIREVLATMSTLKPDVKLDDEFKFSLKKEIESRYSTKKTTTYRDTIKYIATFFSGAAIATSFVIFLTPSVEPKVIPVPAGLTSWNENPEMLRSFKKSPVEDIEMFMENEMVYDMDSLDESTFEVESVWLMAESMLMWDSNDHEKINVSYNYSGDLAKYIPESLTYYKLESSGSDYPQSFAGIKENKAESLKNNDSIRDEIASIWEMRPSASSITENTKLVELALEDPKLVYAKVYLDSWEALVPALEFRVIEPKEKLNTYYEKKILINLVDLK